MIQDLSAPDPTSVFNLFGLIDWTPPAFMMIGVWPCLMLIIMIIQKQLNPPPQDQLQRDLMRFFPFVITYVLSRFASGLVIYWTFSAFIGVVQQMIIMHSMGVPIYLFDKTEAEKHVASSNAKPKTTKEPSEVIESSAEETPKEIKPPKPKKKKKKK